MRKTENDNKLSGDDMPLKAESIQLVIAMLIVNMRMIVLIIIITNTRHDHAVFIIGFRLTVTSDQNEPQTLPPLCTHRNLPPTTRQKKQQHAAL